MVWIGVLVTLFGFVLSVVSLGTTSSVGARLILVLAGMGISLVGIIGIINRAFVKKAIWRR